MAATDEVARGAKFVVYAVKDTAEAGSRVAEFIAGMRDEDQKKLMALIWHTADYGPPRNRRRSNDLAEDLFELKSGPFRVPYFYDGREGDRGRIILTHVFRKTGDKAPKRQVETALRLREEYWGTTGR